MRSRGETIKLQPPQMPVTVFLLNFLLIIHIIAQSEKNHVNTITGTNSSFWVEVSSCLSFLQFVQQIKINVIKTVRSLSSFKLHCSCIIFSCEHTPLCYVSVIYHRTIYYTINHHSYSAQTVPLVQHSNNSANITGLVFVECTLTCSNASKTPYLIIFINCKRHVNTVGSYDGSYHYIRPCQPNKHFPK